GEALREAAARMEKEGVGLLVVPDAEGRPEGVLTDRDLALALGASPPSAEPRRVADVATRPAIAVADDVSLEDAITRMRERRVRRLPVVDADERLVGVLSLDDLALLLAREIAGLGDVLVAQLPAGGSRALGREAPGAAPSRTAGHYRGPVVTVPLEAPVLQLVEAMARHEVGTVVVTGHERAVGLVTDRDVAIRAVARGLDPRTTPASAVMSTPLLSADPSEPLEEVVARMRAASVRRLPVLREGRAVGLMAFDDLLVALGRELDGLGACVVGGIRAARLRSVSTRLLREVEDRLEEAGSQLRRIGDQTLRSLGRELEDVVDRVTGGGRRAAARRREAVRVADLMQTDVRRCQPDDALSEAARIMWERDCGCAPVVAADGSGRVVGMITDRDVCMAAWTRGAPLARIPVGDVMARRVHAVHPDDDVAEAEALMRSARVRRLPVVDDTGHLRGVLSLADLAEAAAGARGAAAGAVDASEVGVVLESICRPRSGLVAR
ncbi:MAG: CBS domain-containing protein, partial [Myxococcota bacterium]|nr:CBS domain-containing protein [Myxococcota bacterium]